MPGISSPARRVALAGLAMLAIRLGIIAFTPDLDTDAYAHFTIARALARDPGNLHVHWVWLPGYHYAVAALVRLGLGFTGLRALDALLQAAAPLLLYDLCARRGGDDPEHARRVGLLAALAWTLAPIANRLATSAQPETVFTILALASAWAIERRRPWLAGGLLAAACLVRYEAWGAIPALALHRLVRRKDPIGIASFALPAIAIAGWILLRRSADGEWLTFVRHTLAFADGVRAAQALPPLVDRLLLPLALPPLVLGPAIVLLPVGIRRAIRVGWLVPAGILAFLLASYVGRGALGLERYFTALVPFACAAIAEGALRVPGLAKRMSPRATAAAAIAALGLTTAAHLGWMVHRARARAAELEGYEAAVSR